MIKHQFKLLLALFFLIIIILSLTPTTYAISLDTTFGNDGKVITTFGYEAVPLKLMQQSNGKKIIVGGVVDGSNRNWAIARYHNDGGLDTSFGNNGIILKDFGINGQQNSHGDFLKSIVFQPDGKIVVGGSSAISPTISRWTLARYNENGSLDESFGDKGIVITTLRNNFVIEYINSLTIQPDNKIIAVGVSHISNTDVAIARYNPDGTLDSTFSGDGIVTTQIGGNNDRSTAAALQSDGKIVVFGDYDAGGRDKIFLSRYNTDGSIDNSFDGDGKATTEIGGYDGARAMVIQPDGKIVVTGGTNINGSGDTYIARYNANGTLDNTFGTGGKVVKSFAAGNDGASSLILQQDGKIILGGYENVGGASGYDFALRRFNNNGTLDTEFGANGSFVTPVGPGNDVINSIALQDESKIIAAGAIFNGTYNDWGLVRYSLPPQPFLDLPWDYENKGNSFVQLAFDPNSWFDHKYPLQNEYNINKVLMYDGIERDVSYRSHSGYDYGLKHGIVLNTPVLAAATGTATFKPESKTGGAGNMIKIDHGNNYQTWYEHLQPTGLITMDENNGVYVNQGDQIGLVGMTGITTGPHIHLSVFKDSNENDNFNDDYPHGLVDPLGWLPITEQAIKIDPWTEYAYNGTDKGSESYNLFTERIGEIKKTIIKSGGTLNSGKISINFPADSTTSNFTTTLNYGPFESVGNNKESIAPSLLLKAYNLIGDPIKLFFKPVQIKIDYSEAELININEDSIKLNHYNEGTQTWEPLNTIEHNKILKTIIAETNSFSRFALMADVLDKSAPTTEIKFIGDKGEDDWFRSNVTVELNSQDNEGGVGLEYTLYTFDGSYWQEYTQPLIFNEEGDYTITYQSFDKADNKEKRHTRTFHIDKTLPLVSIEASPDTIWPPNGKMVDVKITGNKIENHLKTIKFNVEDEYNLIEPDISNFGDTIRLEAKRNGNDEDGRIYTIQVIVQDLAGNTAQASSLVTVPHDQRK